MYKVLFLDTGFDSSSEYFRKQREMVSGCTNKCLYKKPNKSLFSKIVMAFGVYIFSPVLYFLYGDWKKHLNEYDIFIISSRRAAKYAIKYIKRKTNKRVIVWYWNMVTSKEISPDFCRKFGCEPWSFDKSDCEKYGMKFGDTYYFPPEKDPVKKIPEYGMFYVGINRPGRKELLDSLGEYLKKHDLKYRFNLTAIPTEPASVRAQFSPRMDYAEVIGAITDSESILDLNRDNQSGMTLRPMEALFFKRKLVTNNEHIVEYSIYDKKNTYIISDNDFSGLDNFIKTPYIEDDSNRNKRNAYCYQQWLERICNNIEAE